MKYKLHYVLCYLYILYKSVFKRIKKLHILNIQMQRLQTDVSLAEVRSQRGERL